MLLQQNWSPAQRAAFHHMAQVTRLTRYACFNALEQPCFTACGDLADPAYLARFGFIPSDENPDNLRVGFARHDNFHDPITKERCPVVGFTFAACYTGELVFEDSAIRMEGGPAMVDLGTFQKAVGLALGLTQKLPWRYARFEKRVLGEGATDAQKAELKKNVDAFLPVGCKERDYAQEHNIYTNLSGFGRTDALTRIGNQEVAVDLGLFEDFQASNASVRFPRFGTLVAGLAPVQLAVRVRCVRGGRPVCAYSSCAANSGFAACLPVHRRRAAWMKWSSSASALQVALAAR